MRGVALGVFLVVATPYVAAVGALREISWDQIAPPVQALLAAQGVTPEGFHSHVADLRSRNQARMREGDLDHLVHYMLQSSSFTRAPVIEPAQSAAEFVTSGAVPRSAAGRIAAFADALAASPRNIRFRYFRDLLDREQVEPSSLRPFLAAQYARAMRFLYKKEFSEKDSAAIGSLYQQRGLSTDTSVDACYVVYLALATLRQLEPDRHIQRVLIVGPGLDLAPRTGLVETSAPQSYQPFAVMDALVATGLSNLSDLRMSAIDINPRVVAWLQGANRTPLNLNLYPGIAESARVRLTDDYRTYFAALGTRIGRIDHAGLSPRITKTVAVSASAASSLDAATADITVERTADLYDLIVVTNVFPYLSNAEVLLALSNVIQMLKPGGVLLHNEPRPLLASAALALGLPLIHARSAVIATVEGGVPLYDSVWMHSVSASSRTAVSRPD